MTTGWPGIRCVAKGVSIPLHTSCDALPVPAGYNAQGKVDTLTSESSNCNGKRHARLPLFPPLPIKHDHHDRTQQSACSNMAPPQNVTEVQLYLCKSCNTAKARVDMRSDWLSQCKACQSQRKAALYAKNKDQMKLRSLARYHDSKQDATLKRQKLELVQHMSIEQLKACLGGQLTVDSVNQLSASAVSNLDVLASVITR